MDAEHKWYEEYGRRIEQILKALTKNLPSTTVNLVLAHLLVDGARVGTGERELHLGQIYGLNPQQLPSSVQYIALGHLHRAQEVLAPAKTLYPGSLIELDFGEEQQDKSVVVFEAAPQKAPKIELVPITAGRRLRTVTARLDDLERYAEEWTDDYLRVRVRADSPTPGLAERTKELLPNALDVTVEYPRDPAQANKNGQNGAGRVKLAPSQLFAAYYEHRHQTKPPQELQQLFDQVHEEATRS
jgi:exonuclease SbcD